MDEWEIIKKCTRYLGVNYGPDWAKVPAIAITKQGLSFNSVLREQFSIPEKCYLNAFSTARKFGIQVAVNDGELLNGFKLQSSGKGSAFISCLRLAKKLKEHHGIAFRARLVPGSRIIECSLDEPLNLKE